jgi:two-component system, NtrC family, sensor kinase
MFGSANPTLRISTSESAGRIIVRISDSGSGIAREHLHRIYDPFFTTKTKPQEGEHKGTGLGLAVSYGIMQEHAGKIHVESEPGKGTTFHLEFPASGLRPANVLEQAPDGTAREVEAVGRNTTNV